MSVIEFVWESFTFKNAASLSYLLFVNEALQQRIIHRFLSILHLLRTCTSTKNLRAYKIILLNECCVGLFFGTACAAVINNANLGDKNTRMIVLFTHANFMSCRQLTSDMFGC